MASRRKRYEKLHSLAADGVLAYLRDDDADLSNIIESAVSADPLAATWNVTALAAASIRMWAQHSGISPEAALAQVVENGYGGLFRAPQPAKQPRATD